MKLNTEDREKDIKEDKEHWKKGTTKTIGNVKRVVKKMFGDNDTEAEDKPKEE